MAAAHGPDCSVGVSEDTGAGGGRGVEARVGSIDEGVKKAEAAGFMCTSAWPPSPPVAEARCRVMIAEEGDIPEG